MEIRKRQHTENNNTAYKIGNCCTTPILGTKTRNSINNNLFKSDFREVFCFT